MKTAACFIAVSLCAGASVAFGQAATQNSALPTIDADGTVHIPAYSAPLPRYMSDEAKRQFIENARKPRPQDSSDQPSAAVMRARVDADIAPKVERAKTLYPVNIEEGKIAGVRTHTVVPKSGVAASNRERVLINLHGGGFLVGGGLHGLLESIPVAGVGKIKVVTVDYRMAPEYKFPAASEDVEAVYRFFVDVDLPESQEAFAVMAKFFDSHLGHRSK